MNKKGIIIAICVLIFLFIASLVTKYIDTANVSTGEILEGEGYKFIESKSSKIPKYKYSSDAKEAFAPVVDGAVFD